MKNALQNICAAFALALIPVATLATPVFISGVTQASGWIDTDKSWVDDTQLCWAASAANILAFTGWGGGPAYRNASQIFGDFVSHWNDAPGNPYYGVQWWFSGQNGAQGWNGWAQLTDTTQAGFYSQALFNNNFKEFSMFVNGFESQLDNSIRNGVGGFGTSGLSMVLGWYDAQGRRNGGHVLTLWGIDTTENTLYVTDSDDNAHRLEEITYDENSRRLTNYSNGSGYIEYLYALDEWSSRDGDPLPKVPTQIPEPSSLALIAAGLFGVSKIIQKHRVQG